MQDQQRGGRTWHHSVRTAVIVAEFHENGCRIEQIDNGSHLAASQPLLRQIHQQGNNVQQNRLFERCVHHFTQHVTNRGGPDPAGESQRVLTTAPRPDSRAAQVRECQRADPITLTLVRFAPSTSPARSAGEVYQAASFSAMSASFGTRPAGPSAASVGLARNCRAAARCTSSVVTAFSLPTVSAVGTTRPNT